MKKLRGPKLTAGPRRRPPKNAYYAWSVYTIDTASPLVFKVCVFVIDKERKVRYLGKKYGYVYDPSEESVENAARRVYQAHYTKKSAETVKLHECPIPRYVPGED